MGFELIPAAKISSSGLSAERTRMEVAANNIANAQSTAADPKNLYAKKMVIFESVLNRHVSGPGSKLGGVQVTDIVSSKSKPIEFYNPSHPHANENGMVQKPNLAPLKEMVDMITATRAYEANLSILKQSKKIAEQTINIGK